MNKFCLSAQTGADSEFLSTRKLACIPSVYQHPGQYWLHLLFWCTSWCLFCLLIDAQVGVVSVSLWICKLVWNPSAYRRAGLCWFCPLIDPQVGVDSIFLSRRKLVLIPSFYWQVSWCCVCLLSTERRASRCWFCLLIKVQVGLDSVFL